LEDRDIIITIVVLLVFLIFIVWSTGMNSNTFIRDNVVLESGRIADIRSIKPLVITDAVIGKIWQILVEDAGVISRKEDNIDVINWMKYTDDDDKKVRFVVWENGVMTEECTFDVEIPVKLYPDGRMIGNVIKMVYSRSEIMKSNIVVQVSLNRNDLYWDVVGRLNKKNYLIDNFVHIEIDLCIVSKKHQVDGEYLVEGYINGVIVKTS
jgi:hypothetical protein